MTSIPKSSELTEEERDTVGLGNLPVLADPKDTVLSGRGLIKTFGRVSVSMVSMSTCFRAILAVIGDNGAGKSTLIKALTGALIPDSGQVFRRPGGAFQDAAGCPGFRHRDRLPDTCGRACPGHLSQHVPWSGTTPLRAAWLGTAHA